MFFKSRLFISVLVIIGIISIIFIYHNHNTCECKTRISYKNTHINNGIDLKSLYNETDSIEISDIKSYWKNFNSKSDSSKILVDGINSNKRKFLILKHYFNGQKHFGAVIFPKDYDKTKKYPLLVFASGLNQIQPSVNLNMRPNIKEFFSDLSNYFIVIPSYRGQSLIAKNKEYCSDGFFGDAFDGATDDTLRLLEYVKYSFKGVDKKRIAVYGESRGGTVALLMGIRDKSIHAVISAAGPTNFFSIETYNRYGLQYKYQFLSKKLPLKELRFKMIKSSPVYFINNYSNNLFLIHGKNDHVVSISNTRNLIKELKVKEKLDTLITNNGHDFKELNLVYDWLKEKNR